MYEFVLKAPFPFSKGFFEFRIELCHLIIELKIMKFGEHLKANISPEYGEAAYLNYSELDDIIRDLSLSAPSG
jgi:hypothetical protein